MARTVKVSLVLDNTIYVRGARESVRETKNVTDSVEDLGDAGEKASRETENLGDELSELARDARRLDTQIDEAKDGIRELARQIAATSDEASRADLTKKLKVDQADLRRNLNLRKLMEVEAEDAAGGFAAHFGGRIGPLMASAPIASGAGAAGAALGLAMAPTLAGALSGAVVGGAAGAGIVGGVMLAARDPRVQAAGKDLGAFVLADLEQRAQSFTPVVLDSIGDIRAGWSKLGPDLTRIFDSSRLVDPLVAGMVSGSQRLIGGIADAVENADPVVNAFGGLLDGVGDAAGDAFSLLAQDADEGASAIDDLTTSVTNFVRVSAGIVHAGAAVKGWADQVDNAIDKGRYWTEDWMSSGGVLEHFGVQLDLTADGFKAGSQEADAYRKATLGTAEAADFATLKTAGMTDAEISAADASGTYRQTLDGVNDELGNTATQAATATVEVETLSEAIRRMAGENITAEQANMRLEEAIDRATEAGRKNNAGIDVGTEKGRTNRQALIGIAEAANASSAAILTQTGSQELASAATDRGRAKFIESARAMGVSKAEAKLLADQLFAIPASRTSVVTVTANTQPALDNARGVVARINNMNARIRVSAEPSGGYGGSAHTGAGYSTGQRWGGVTEYAQTGLLRDASIFNPVGKGARYGFAEPETGGELFAPKYGDMDRTRAIVGYAIENWWGGWRNFAPKGGATAPSGGSTVNVNLSAYSNQFSLTQVMQDLAMRGAH